MGFALGSLTVLAELAVYVLMHQIEEVTSGYIKSMVLIFFQSGLPAQLPCPCCAS